jgi:hypothetical protein
MRPGRASPPELDASGEMMLLRCICDVSAANDFAPHF